jgi:hypothetical protein
MLKPDTHERLTRRYLVGDLPESESNELEIEVLRDDETFEQLWEIENTLVDGYVRGRLSSAERDRFERHYLSSPTHRQRLAVARRLVAEADRSQATLFPRPAKQSWGARLSERLGFSLLSWQSALTAAALLLAAGSLWLFLDRSHLHQRQEELRSQTQSQQDHEQVLSAELSTARSENQRLQVEIERLRAEQNVKAQAPSQSTQRPAIFSLLLSPTLMRSGDNPQTAKIPHQIDFVRLQLRVDEENARRFHVKVRTVEGGRVWEQQINARNSMITAQIPAGKLTVGDYILTLSAINPTGRLEEVNRYFFRVVGP